MKFNFFGRLCIWWPIALSLEASRRESYEKTSAAKIGAINERCLHLKLPEYVRADFLF